MSNKKFFGRGKREKASPAVHASPAQQPEIDYAGIFLKNKKLKTRQSVYISQDVHAAISRLVHLLAVTGNKISVGCLIDNILSEHLKSHKERIVELYREQLKEL